MKNFTDEIADERERFSTSYEMINSGGSSSWIKDRNVFYANSLTVNKRNVLRYALAWSVRTRERIAKKYNAFSSALNTEEIIEL